MNDSKIEVAVNFEKCRVLVSLLGNTTIPDGDRETLVWILEEYINRLGDAIGKSEMR